MADVASDIKDWSATASSNSPTDSTSIGAGLADNFQQIQATVKIALNHKGADIASSATTDLGATVGLYHDITGTTTITSFGTTAATGQWKLLQFDGALSITYNATSMILPGNASITTAAGDMAMVIHEGSGNWRMLWYTDDSTSPILLDEDTMSSDSAVHAASQQSIKAYIGAYHNGLTAETSPATGDTVPLYDADEAADNKITLANLLKVVNSLTEDTAPDISADYFLTYDADAGAAKKVLSNKFGLTLATKQATTSGTSIDFTSIPAWVKRITIMFSGVSTSGTSEKRIQIGHSGGVEATGYLGSGSRNAAASNVTATATNGFNIYSVVAADLLNGSIVLTLMDSATFLWTCQGFVSDSASSTAFGVSGSKALSAALDRVRITTNNGTDTFDAGSINIMYE